MRRDLMRVLNKLVLCALLLGLLMACGQNKDAGGNTGGGAAVPAGSVGLRLLYGSEKQAWMEDVIATFNASGAKTPSGAPIMVEAVAMGSGESLDAIISGSQAADLWSPASALYLPMAQDAWSKAKPGAASLLDAAKAEPLVLSPVVIAMWRPMAQALGWPDKQVGWHELADLATSGKTWADFGHPEWGSFQFGHTHPDYSNSGLAAITALAYAAANKTSGLTVADVQAPATATLINSVEQAVIHYGSSTGFFASAMFDRGASYLSAAVLYENLVIESYDRSLHPNIDLPIVALYPEEGSFWSDHPLAVLNTPAMTDDKRAAAEVLRAFLLAKPQQEAALKYGFRPANLEVPLAAPIDSIHGVDPTQLQVALPVPSAEVIQAIRQTWQANKKQVDVSIVVDVSGSMRQENRLREAKTALGEFLNVFADNDHVGVTIFSTDASELSPLDPIGPKRADLQTRVADLVANGDTRLYSTTSDAYTKLQQQPAGGRIRALVVLTDGEDTASTISVDELIDTIKADEEGTSIKIFTIAYGADANFDVLTRIAESTGGKAFKGDPATIKQIYTEIATFF
jgi:Ca-activated chloride channel family protein